MANQSRNRDYSHGTEPEAFGDRRLGEVHDALAREKGEPAEGYSLTYAPIVGLVIAFLAVVSVWYITRPANNGGFSGVWNQNMTQADYAKANAPKGPKSVAAQIRDGKALFENNCASCHQVTGTGAPGVFPPLAGSAWVHGTPDRIIKIASYGLVGEVEVAGAKYNGNMPAIGEGLSDQKLADLATYVRQAWGNKAEPVTPEQVKAARAAAGKRGQFTGPELLSAHPLETK